MVSCPLSSGEWLKHLGGSTYLSVHKQQNWYSFVGWEKVGMGRAFQKAYRTSLPYSSKPLHPTTEMQKYIKYSIPLAQWL